MGVRYLVQVFDERMVLRVSKVQAGLLACVFLMGCNSPGPTPDTKNQPEAKPVIPNPYSPKPTDAKWTRGGVDIQRTTIAGSASNAASMLTITGNLPTPCHELRLRIPDRPDAQGVLRIEAWSVSDPDRMCAQVLQPFSVQVQVRRGKESTILLNGHEVGK